MRVTCIKCGKEGSLMIKQTVSKGIKYRYYYVKHLVNKKIKWCFVTLEKNYQKSIRHCYKRVHKQLGSQKYLNLPLLVKIEQKR